MHEAPDLCDFEQVVNKFKAGHVNLSSGKDFKLAWCLYQAMKKRDVAVLKRATMICLFRDERKTRLAVSARVVTSDLQSVAMSFGTRRDLGTGSKEVTLGTYRIIKDLCTLFDSPGRKIGTIRCRPELDKQLLAQIRSKIRIICVDSASDELLSCDMMRSAELMGTTDALTPNLSLILRDKAHASKRITSRPWSADPYLSETMNMFCRGRPSATRIVPTAELN